MRVWYDARVFITLTGTVGHHVSTVGHEPAVAAVARDGVGKGV